MLRKKIGSEQIRFRLSHFLTYKLDSSPGNPTVLASNGPDNARNELPTLQRSNPVGITRCRRATSDLGKKKGRSWKAPPGPRRSHAFGERRALRCRDKTPPAIE